MQKVILILSQYKYFCKLTNLQFTLLYTLNIYMRTALLINKILKKEITVDKKENIKYYSHFYKL